MCKKKIAIKIFAVTAALSIVLSGCASSSPTPSKNNESIVSENTELDSSAEQGDEDLKTKETSEIEDIDMDLLVEEIPEDDLSPTQRNSINMLNYMSTLTQKVNESSGNQMLLEELYSSLVSDMYPNAVDTKTQAQITSLMDTIANYQMITEKRNRLEYIYDQNRAQALRQAIPNPVGLLSAVESGSLLKSAASVLYMAVDSASSYKAATSQADLQYIQEGWELEDQEKAELHNSTKSALNYMYDMVRDYDIDGDLALSQEHIEDFVEWSGKPESQLVSKTEWFKSHEDTYREFGPYWLELVKYYYNMEDYAKCLESIRQYESLATRIYRKDLEKATVLPMVIVSAKETLAEDEYIKLADQYCSEICDNTGDEDWSLKYYAAQIYMDLYTLTEDKTYLEAAYKIARDNVIVLADNQRILNKTFMADVQEIESKKDDSESKKKETKKYNKLLKKERKIALPPVSEALYLNADLLFALAKELDVSEEEKETIEAILHENEDAIFLAKSLDQRFWFEEKYKDFDIDKINISFDGDKLSIPASCVTDRVDIQVIVSGKKKETIIEDWTVTKVKRQKKSKDCSEFIATFESEKAKDYKYKSGDKISIKVMPVADTPNENMVFQYAVKADKKFLVFDGVKLERMKNE